MKSLTIKTGPNTVQSVKVKSTSSFLSWKLVDFLKGLIMAVGTPVLYLVQEMIPGWPLSPIEKAALSATVTYLLKNLFTSSQIVIKKADLPQ